MTVATPNGLFSSNYTIRDATGPVATIEMAKLSYKGTVQVSGVPYPFRQTDAFAKRFVLSFEGVEIGWAERTSVWTSTIEVAVSTGISQDVRALQLTPLGALSTGYHVAWGGEGSWTRIGQIRRKSAFSRDLEIDLPDEVPVALQGFLTALLLIDIRRRQSG